MISSATGSDQQPELCHSSMPGWLRGKGNCLWKDGGWDSIEEGGPGVGYLLFGDNGPTHGARTG